LPDDGSDNETPLQIFLPKTASTKPAGRAEIKSGRKLKVKKRPGQWSVMRSAGKMGWKAHQEGDGAYFQVSHRLITCAGKSSPFGPG